jgi:glycosyltransferase involved in cell wall biosynthesis
MRLSLIITTYNRPESLELVLRSIECQTITPEEVIIADDGSTPETKALVSRFQQDSELSIIYSWQEDKGFRAAKSRNKAIAKSNTNYIVLIDGDMILHPRFIEDHISDSKSGYFVQGSRVLLTQNKTKRVLDQQKINFSFFSIGLLNRKNAFYSNSLSTLMSRDKNFLGGIKSCNMAFFKQDCIDVNGFNNDFKGWGREDSEFIVRLLNSGIRRKSLHFNAIQYHLWHNENKNTLLNRNDAMLQHALFNHLRWCDNGIDRYL